MAKEFPDLTGDGKVTQADVLKGRGVFNPGGPTTKMTAAQENAQSYIKLYEQMQSNLRRAKDEKERQRARKNTKESKTLIFCIDFL